MRLGNRLVRRMLAVGIISGAAVILPLIAAARQGFSLAGCQRAVWAGCVDGCAELGYTCYSAEWEWNPNNGDCSGIGYCT